MPEIKTRNVVKGTVKTIDKAAIAGERMKEAYVRTRDKAQQNVSTAEGSPEEYATDRFSGSTEAVTYEAAHQIGKQGRKAVRATEENISSVKDRLEQHRADQPKRAMQKQATERTAETVRRGSAVPSDVAGQPTVAFGKESPAIEAAKRSHETIKATDQIGKTSKQVASSAGEATVKTTRGAAMDAEHTARTTIKTAQRTAKTTDQASGTVIKAPQRTAKTTEQAARTAIKTTQRTVKTTDRAAGAAIKTAQASAKAAQESVQRTIKTSQRAAKTSQRAAQAARAAAKSAEAGIKVTAKATAAAVKAIIAATKALVSAILAGGWIAIVIILVISMIGLLVGSCFGIFFSSEDSGTGQTMQTVVREINDDYQAQLDTIKANVSYDVLEMSGSRAVWPEVLSVYAVKTATDPDQAQEVATMDDSKKAILKDIFWQMNAISSHTETKTETVIQESDDGQGNIINTEMIATRTYLYITVSHKTAEEMADHFNFNADQREQLSELLTEENRSLWSTVLYGIGSGDGEIVTVAMSQIGNVGGEPYWSWYGFSSHVEWCACFVSWCANECGYLEAGVLPKFAGVGTGVDWFQARGLWQDNSYEPRPGDVIFFDWDDESGQDGLPDHVGIVEKVEDSIVYTVEGNSGDTCLENHYTVGHYEIFGYATPAY